MAPDLARIGPSALVLDKLFAGPRGGRDWVSGDRLGAGTIALAGARPGAGAGAGANPGAGAGAGS